MIKIITISSACLALTLSACSKEQTAELVQSDTDNATEQSQTLRIAAAANLSDVLPEIIAAYQADKTPPAQAIDVTYASSGKLYAQITSGAPYDIFLSANQEFPAKLAKEKLDNAKSADEATHEPFTYTQGQLALYSVNKSLKGLNTTTLNALLMSESDSKITIANPELAPYGKSHKPIYKHKKSLTLSLSKVALFKLKISGKRFNMRTLAMSIMALSLNHN